VTFNYGAREIATMEGTRIGERMVFFGDLYGPLGYVGLGLWVAMIFDESGDLLPRRFLLLSYNRLLLLSYNSALIFRILFDVS